MPKWDRATLDRFIDAEAALVNRQLTLAAEGKDVWTAWRNIRKGIFSQYGQLLVEQKFGDIVVLTKRL
ncbi:hypothetical protein FJY63_11005 [Candidatus Sumerlaeota bacterium]|nr:hypothetical protein [Candidatus Sumerlaeota bacterium]